MSGNKHRNSGEFVKSNQLNEMTNSFSEKLSFSVCEENAETSLGMQEELRSSEELKSVISQVEESLSPLARASCQIRDSVASLEKQIIALKIASGQGMNNGH